MPLYQHRYRGVTSMGDIWIWSWWATDDRTTVDANAAAVAWGQMLWNGSAGGNGFGSLTTADVQLQQVSTGRIDVATGHQDELAESVVALAGTAIVGALPADVALCVSLRTGLANRRGRGRFFLPQPAVSVLSTDGRLADAARTTVLDALTAAWTGYNSATASPVVYSRMSRATTVITSFDIGNLMDTQRRRENAITEGRLSAVMP